MTKLLPTLAFIFLTHLAIAQKSTVTGTINDNNQKSLLGVNISVKNTNKGTQTNERGDFEIENLEKGDFTLSISSLGFKTKEIPISITNNQILNLGNITLYEGNEILGEVVIEGERVNKFSRKKTAYVAKLPLKDIENTQVYSTITTELLESQVVTNFDDALKNATGVEQLWASTGRGGRWGRILFLTWVFGTAAIGKWVARFNKWNH